LTKTGGLPAANLVADAKRVLYYGTDETGAYLGKSGNSRTELVSVDIPGDTQYRIERGEAVAAVVAGREDQLCREGEG
jgi:hypothetical protein